MAWHADEPFAISSAFALYFLAQMARQHVKVVLTGDGGDEVFAGYTWRHVGFPALEHSIPSLQHHLPTALHQLLAKMAALARAAGLLPTLKALSHSIAAKLSSPPMSDIRYVQSFICFRDHELKGLLVPAVWQAVRQAWADNITQRYYDRFESAEQLTRKLYTDIKATLVSEMLTKVDRMTMAFGLEARVPFLDHRVVEWAFGIPSTHKMHGTEGKYIVKKTMERYLPTDVLYRPKHGFNVPMKVWMKHQLYEFICDTLSTRAIQARGVFRANRVSNLLQEHIHGNQDASNKIFVMVMLELWFQYFIDRRHEIYAKS
jgi:asparagine synthase (glutamine-hydrolysing)